MIDPAWPSEMWSAKGYRKAPEAQYKTMSMADILRLPVGTLLKPRGVAWIWCTWPLLVKGRIGNMIEHAWGLEPATGGAWAKRTKTGKLRWGTGYLIRSVCEPFIIATKAPNRAHGFRGRSAPNLIETMHEAVLDGLAREHSRKPDEAYALIEKIMPAQARMADIYARQVRPRWIGWGLEMGKF